MASKLDLLRSVLKCCLGADKLQKAKIAGALVVITQPQEQQLIYEQKNYTSVRKVLGYFRIETV